MATQADLGIPTGPYFSGQCRSALISAEVPIRTAIVHVKLTGQVSGDQTVHQNIYPKPV